MKPIFFHPAQYLLMAGITLFAAIIVQAQPVAQDDAAQSAYNPGGFTGTNGGFGFGPWVLADNNNSGTTNFAGFLHDSSGAAAVDTSNKSFGMYANGATYTYATAYRSFSNSLTTNVAFILKFKNTTIASGGAMGFSLFNGANFTRTNTLASLAGNSRFSFYFLGGNAGGYVIRDGNVTTDSGVGWTSGGLTLEFSLQTADIYRLTIKNADGTVILASFADLPLLGASGGTIDSFACYNFQTANNENAYFNQFAVVPISLIPPVIQNVLPTNGSFYLPTSSTITFDAISLLSGIATNGIKVSLNGSNVTSYAFTGSPTNWSVTASPVLVPNMIYNAVITVTDINGNHATNTFTFNTWSPTGMFIEAEDYNYSSGHFIAAPTLYQYAGITAPASNNIDFLEYGDPTNSTGAFNNYRPQDPIWLEVSGDPADHAGFQTTLGVTNFAMGFINNGEWENYTRRITNGAYNVYARMSGGPAPTMLMERTASPTATTTNQPRAALGTFVGTDTHNITSNYTFVPLKDFFSTPVVLRFSTNAPTTNTFRLSDIGYDAYNFDYLIFVPVAIANTNTQRPYISAGFPYPGAGGILPDQNISFTIANRDTTVSSVQLLVNGADVSGSLVFNNNAAGTVVTYTPATLYPLNTNTTVRAIFTDTAGIKQTNDWQFGVANILVVPTTYALASGSGVSNGFNVHLVKYPNIWPATTGLTNPSSACAEAMLAGTVTSNGVPYSPDINTNFAETGAINYDICGAVLPYDGWTFSNEVAFPNIPTVAPCYNNTNGTDGPNNFALSAGTYVQLSAGLYQWVVRSDDGFRLTTGTNLTAPTDFKIMDWEGARGAASPSYFYFIIQTTGLYPMRLLYYQGGFGASVELYSIDRLTGQNILINDPNNANSIKAYRTTTAAAVPVVLLNPHHTGVTATFSFVTQAGKTHLVKYKNALTDATWQLLQTVTGNGSTTNITDATASGAARFYHVETQ